MMTEEDSRGWNAWALDLISREMERNNEMLADAFGAEAGTKAREEAARVDREIRALREEVIELRAEVNVLREILRGSVVTPLRGARDAA